MRSVGALIALYERAVGFYASLVNINAYHQPGVEAGTKMAGAVIALQRNIIAYLRNNAGQSFTAEEIARALDAEGGEESVLKILEHACANHNPVGFCQPAQTELEIGIDPDAVRHVCDGRTLRQDLRARHRDLRMHLGEAEWAARQVW